MMKPGEFFPRFLPFPFFPPLRPSCVNLKKNVSHFLSLSLSLSLTLSFAAIITTREATLKRKAGFGFGFVLFVFFEESESFTLSHHFVVFRSR